MGRPAYTPTDKDRKQVKMLSGMGVPGVDIAALDGVTPIRALHTTEAV